MGVRAGVGVEVGGSRGKGRSERAVREWGSRT